MTKSQEIDVLRDCVTKLGPDSYSSRWLADLIPFLESEIRSDTFPHVTLPTIGQYREEGRAIVCCAKAEAMEMVSRAKSESDKLVSDARARADGVIRSAASALRAAMYTLE